MSFGTSPNLTNWYLCYHMRSIRNLTGNWFKLVREEHGRTLWSVSQRSSYWRSFIVKGSLLFRAPRQKAFPLIRMALMAPLYLYTFRQRPAANPSLFNGSSWPEEILLKQIEGLGKAVHIQMALKLPGEWKGGAALIGPGNEETPSSRLSAPTLLLLKLEDTPNMRERERRREREGRLWTFEGQVEVSFRGRKDARPFGTSLTTAMHRVGVPNRRSHPKLLFLNRVRCFEFQQGPSYFECFNRVCTSERPGVVINARDGTRFF